MQPKPVAPHITRSGTLVVIANESPACQSETKDSPPKEQQRALTLIESDDIAPPVTHKAFSMSIITLQPIVEALNKILDGNRSMVDTIRGIFRYIRELVRAEGQRKEGLGLREEVSGLHKIFQHHLKEVCNYLNKQLQGVQSKVNATLETSKKALKVAKEIKGSTADIISRVGKVTNATDKIADTTQSYCNVLMSRQPLPNKASVNPKVLSNMECKDKQILVDIFNEEGDNTMGKSLSELMDKVTSTLENIKDRGKPELVKVESLYKTRKNVILLTLNSKEVAKWLREVENEMAFVDSFLKGAHFRDREYNLITPRVLLTFNPSNTKHLREIEEYNNLPPHTILKARWIKPEGHRQPRQTYAYAILTVTLVDTANKLIRDGVSICGSHSRPSKQKIEPIQCMKCRQWGHFANKCTESKDTCGTCSEKHYTSLCQNSNKLYCVVCTDSTHASWHRACPEFLRWCKSINDTNLANNMLFFPAEQDWTLSIRSTRILLNEHFPTSYRVNSLPIDGRRNLAPCRKGPNCTANPSQENPNLILLPEVNRFVAKELGKITGGSAPS